MTGAMSHSRTIDPFGGFGLGLRRTHYEHFLESDVPVDFGLMIPVVRQRRMNLAQRQGWVLEVQLFGTPAVGLTVQ